MIRWPGIVTAACIVLVVFAIASACDTRKRITYNMTWTITPLDGSKRAVFPAGTKHVVLRYVDFPRYHESFSSRGIASYLEALPTRSVPVELEIMSDFGCMRGYAFTKIGDRDFIPPFDLTSGHEEEPNELPPPSPFRQFECGAHQLFAWRR